VLLQFVAVCCSVLQCVAVWFEVNLMCSPSFLIQSDLYIVYFCLTEIPLPPLSSFSAGNKHHGICKRDASYPSLVSSPPIFPRLSQVPSLCIFLSHTHCCSLSFSHARKHIYTPHIPYSLACVLFCSLPRMLE